MRLFLIMMGIILLMANCQSSQQNSAKPMDNATNMHKVVVNEVIQTSKYTYLRVRENDKEQWLALPTMDAKAGETYYYQGGFEMTKFESTELKRTFDSVIFLDKVTKEPNASNAGTAENPHASGGGGMTKTEKADVKVEKANGGITIAELYANKKNYDGKIVKVKGQVVKYTPAVMGKNWFHIQDGTDFNGKFDLTVSSDAEVKVGEKVTVEGKIILNKDLGFGYVYEVLMENAVKK